MGCCVVNFTSLRCLKHRSVGVILLCTGSSRYSANARKEAIHRAIFESHIVKMKVSLGTLHTPYNNQSVWSPGSGKL